jgi:hypothetical protein
MGFSSDWWLDYKEQAAMYEIHAAQRRRLHVFVALTCLALAIVGLVLGPSPLTSILSGGAGSNDMQRGLVVAVLFLSVGALALVGDILNRAHSR